MLSVLDKHKNFSIIKEMKVKYKIILTVESDTETEDIPDRWDWVSLVGGNAELVAYKEMPPDKEVQDPTI